MDINIQNKIDMELRHAIEIVSYVKEQTKGIDVSDKFRESIALRIYSDISRKNNSERNNRR